ncbi:MAG: cytochrome c3 family protein [Desulfovibrionaceae bacterium]|nr:cytochrome c3 family protein [Desulfovibrionaceae bacterium]
MKYVWMFVLGLTFLFATNAQALDIKQMKEKMNQPITLKADKSSRMDVVFNHSSHRGINCFTCHHKKLNDKDRYVSCSSCHKPLGKSKDPMSKFVAFHDKKSSHSCYACHTNLIKENPQRFGKIFRNCRPCHMPKQKAASM